MNKVLEKARSASTDQVKIMIEAMVNDPRDEAAIVLDALLDVLEERLPASEFVAFCEAVD